MTNKPVSLIQLTNLKDNKELSEAFVRYIAGLPPESKYRHQEIEDISSLLKNLELSDDQCSGFIYGYTIPQFNQEFDLLKISANNVINIELKSGAKPKEEIEKQLKRHEHFLKMLPGAKFLFTYVSSENKLYKLVNGLLVDCSFGELQAFFSSSEPLSMDLDEEFAPKNVLVSPLNDTEKFINGNYLLTDNQENIKKDILNQIRDSSSYLFYGLTGMPGTGKTLLLYDIALTLAKQKRVLIVHGGNLNEGHVKLQGKLQNIDICPAKDLPRYLSDKIDCILVDEAQRLYVSALSIIEYNTIGTNGFCLFSYDPEQRLSHAEIRRLTVNNIESLCKKNIKRLTVKIRTNKEVALFVKCLFNLKDYQKGFSFPHIKVFFEPDKIRAVNLAKSMRNQGYQYIALTPSIHDHELDYQDGNKNTHMVIGQEFDKVCMIIDEHFSYNDEGHLVEAKRHPCPNYICTKLLSQGLTRARTGIALIVRTESLLEKILTLFQDTKNGE